MGLGPKMSGEGFLGVGKGFRVEGLGFCEVEGFGGLSGVEE